MMVYFKPLRRKIGIVTLAVASVFAAGWVRSVGLSDVVEFFPSDSSMIRLNSWDGLVTCGYQKVKPPIKFVKPFLYFVEVIDSYSFEDEFEGCHWMWRIGHTGVATVSDHSYDSIAIVSPYWFIVIPLTLLSAWLLLGKPRAEKPADPTASANHE